MTTSYRCGLGLVLVTALAGGSAAADPSPIEARVHALGIAIPGPAPALGDIDIYIEVPTAVPGSPPPKKMANELALLRKEALPIVQAKTSFKSGATTCYLLEDVDFGAADPSGKLLAEVKVGDRYRSSGVPQTFILKRRGRCRTDAFSDTTVSVTPNHTDHVILGGAPSVTRVTRVTDAAGNTFHQVATLADDLAHGFVVNFDRTSRWTILSFAPSVSGYLQVTYRSGGGVGSNVDANSFRGFEKLNAVFPANPDPMTQGTVRSRLDSKNAQPLGGGEDPPSDRELEKLLTHNDLILWDALGMPTDEGRVYKIGHSGSGPVSVYAVSRSSESYLVKSPAGLKAALQSHLNRPGSKLGSQFTVADAKIIDLRLHVKLTVPDGADRATLVADVPRRVRSALVAMCLDVGEPLSLTDLATAVQSQNGSGGPVGVASIRPEALRGTIANRVYSDDLFDVNANTRAGVLNAPPDTIFDLRYNADIVVEQ